MDTPYTLLQSSQLNLEKRPFVRDTFYNQSRMLSCSKKVSRTRSPMASFDINIKAEGMAIRETQTDVEVFITTDPDDPNKASILYRLLISRSDL